MLDHRLDTVFMQFEVVGQFGVEFLELPRIVISVGSSCTWAACGKVFAEDLLRDDTLCS